MSARAACWIPAAVLYLALAVAARAAEDEGRVVESGKFLLFQAGKPIGTESYRHERFDDREIWSGEVDLETGGLKLRQTPRLVLDRKGRLLMLDLPYAIGGQQGSFTYDFRPGTYRITRRESGKDESEERPLPAGALILSNNVLHHNILIARRYDWARGGRQEFTALPDTSVVLESRGEDRFRLDGRETVYRHLFMTVAGAIGINLWLDGPRLVKMDIPLQRAEIFLEGYEKLEPIAPPSPRAAGIDALEVEFPSGDHRMAGTLTLPTVRKGPVPAVILISGSGPQNRDEDSEGVGGLKLGLFRIVAEKLTAAGIAVLRYDDRGVGRSGGNFPTANMTDLESDARAALAYLRTRPEVDADRVGIVGHSEGAILGARIAASAPAVKALVLMAGTAENGKALLRWQAEKALQVARLSEDARKGAIRNQEEFFELVDKADADVAEVQGQNISIRWFKEFLAYDPLEAVRRVRCPAAILHGEMDVQVPPADARALERTLAEAGNADRELRLFPKLGHLFTESTGNGIAELADTRKTVDPEVLAFIAGFLSRKL